MITYGMIYVENSAGRMANTYIEHSGEFLAFAFTTACTYFGNRYLE